MTCNINTKSALIELLKNQLGDKIDAIKMDIADVSESMKNDTKSSAGDKFETGREMMQSELNNKHAQLNKFLQLKKDLSLISLKHNSEYIEYGSLVISNKGNYLISVAMGKVLYDNTAYYALSLASPIGKQLKGCKVNDEITFNGQSIKILDVI